MSLINKMLQELDARGSPSGHAAQLDVKSVPASVSGMSLRAAAPVAAAVAIVALLGASGVLAWRYFKQPAAPAPKAAQRAVTRVVALAERTLDGPAPTERILDAPAPAATAPAPAPAPAAQAVAARPAPAPAAPLRSDSARKVARLEPAKATARTPAPAVQAVEAAPKAPAPVSIDQGRAEPGSETAKPADDKKARVARERKAAQPPAPGPASAAGRQLSVQQRAESEYRRALASLQDGRVVEAIGVLEQSLRLDPEHEAARQTLIGLLIESRRNDEALRHLQLTLTLDPRQPSMAMLLARIQIERGGSGIDTLMRTLPYAAGDGQYHAFLAGALQREQRHRDAVQQYQNALRGDPGNGVWLMGLGMSLQAEKRSAEALEAYQRARDSAALSPELKAFVERKLQQLAR